MYDRPPQTACGLLAQSPIRSDRSVTWSIVHRRLFRTRLQLGWHRSLVRLQVADSNRRHTPARGLAWLLGQQRGVAGMTIGLGAALILALLLWWLGTRTVSLPPIQRLGAAFTLLGTATKETTMDT